MYGNLRMFPLKCPLITENWHKEPFNVMFGGQKLVVMRLVCSFNADIDDIEWCNSFGSAAGDTGCRNRDKCETYQKLKSQKDMGG